MKNKVLISIYVVSLDETYELYVPTNESIKKILYLISISINELSDSNFDISKEHCLINPTTSLIYQNNQILRETNITNNTKLLLL